MDSDPVRFYILGQLRSSAHQHRATAEVIRPRANIEGSFFMNTRNEIKAIMVREGMTMTEVVEKMADQYGWSASVPNLSGKLRRGSLRYQEAVELADALGYDLVWQKRKERR